MKRRNKGITLISLIITIVIMLILTGITINLLFGDNGLITKTKLAKKAFLGEDAKQVVEDRINAYIAEKGPEGELDLYDFWAMYNSEYLLDEEGESTGVKNLNYDPEFVIYLFEEDVAVKFGEQNVYQIGNRANYKSAVVIYKGFQATVTKNLTVAKEIKEVKTGDEITLSQGNKEDETESISSSPSTWNERKGIQTPALSEGMIPVKYDETASKWKITTVDDLDWYNYKTTSETNTIKGKEVLTEANKWANVMLSDGKYYAEENVAEEYDTIEKTKAEVGQLVEEGDLGSMFVWIPKYAYSIETNYGSSLKNGRGGTINIEFLKTNATTSSKPERTFTTTPGEGKWLIHPAFTSSVDNGGWSSEIPGIWVAKFEASNPSKTASYNSTDKNVRVVPNAQSWKGIQIGDIYTVCRNMTGSFASTYGFKVDKDQTINVQAGTGETYAHLMKNSEWGAVAYLAQSVIGADNEVGRSASGYKTGGGDYISKKFQSTTGNVYGIYDMSGGSYEYVAAYISNGNSNLGNGESFTKYQDINNYQKSSTKYATVYPCGSGDNDNGENNYNLYIGYGDAIKETSKSGAGYTSWFTDRSCFPYSSDAFFHRGGYFNDGTNVGLFNFRSYIGSADSSYGFRPVLVSF